MIVRYFALLLGIAFILAGVGGFIPGVTHPPGADMPSIGLHTSYGLLLGLFPINFVHNLIHLTFGIWGVISYRSYKDGRIYSRGVAIILTVFTVMGLLPALNTTFGLLPLFGHDVWLHGLEAVAAFYFGFLYSPAPQPVPEV